MSRMTFINLPVKDLPRSKEFFTALGFTFDDRFTDDNAASMVISDQAVAMLQAEPFFTGFTGRAVADLDTASEVIVGLSADSRREVDELADKAIEAGAQSLGDADDDGFMYMRGFRDLDGHQWSFIHLDMSAMP